MEFDPYGVSVKDLHTRETLLRCNSEGDLYPLYTPASTSVPSNGVALPITSPEIWHQSLGHPSISSNNFLCCNKISGICNACQLGKHIILPFSNSTSFSSAAFEPIHCNLWTSPIVSVSGFKYYLIFIDDFSHFMWTYPIFLKSDVHSILSNFHDFVRTHFHINIGTIQCDNGKEII
jgi:hypothetical protein